MSELFDVIVLGGGIVGASTAYSLVKQGQNVLLIDRFEAGHTNGSSHGDGRVVRYNYTESIYVEMAMLAYPAWQALSAEVGQPLMQTTGLLECAHQGIDAVQLSEALLKQYDISYEKLTPSQASQRFPQFTFNPQADLLFQPSGGVAFATPTVKALWQLISQKGGQTLNKTHITHIEPASEYVTLTSATGDTYQGKQLILTTGSWNKQFGEMLNIDIPLEITQEILCYFDVDNNINHNVGTMPCMIEFMPNEDIFYCLPIVDVQGVKMGWHHSGKSIDPDAPRVVHEDILTNIQGWAERSFPHVTNLTPIKIDTCLYSNTPDYHFILDKHPHHSNITIGAGFSGHGFKFGLILGDILAGMALGQDAPIDLSFFALKRFQTPENLVPLAGA